MKDIETSSTRQCTSGTTDDLVDAYNSCIKTLMEKHAPNNGSSISAITVLGADFKFEDQHLTHFKASTQYEVRAAKMKSPSKSCEQITSSV